METFFGLLVVTQLSFDMSFFISSPLVSLPARVIPERCGLMNLVMCLNDMISNQILIFLAIQITPWTIDTC